MKTMAQEGSPEETPQAPSKNVGHRWKPGIPSPNPKGRPRTGLAFAEEVRRRVDPGEVIERAKAVMRGQPLVRAVDTSTGKVMVLRDGDEMPPTATITETIWPSVAEVLSACAFLRDSGYTKPPTAIALNVTEGGEAADIDLTKLTPEQLDRYIELQTILEAQEGSKVIEAQGVEQKALVDGSSSK